MKKYFIYILAFIIGFCFGQSVFAAEMDFDLLDRVDKIIDSEEYFNVIDTGSKLEIFDYDQVIYTYVSNEKVQSLNSFEQGVEDISKRTNNSRTFFNERTGQYIKRIYSQPIYEKLDNEWYYVKKDITSKADYENAILEFNVIDYLSSFFGQSVFAEISSSTDGNLRDTFLDGQSGSQNTNYGTYVYLGMHDEPSFTRHVILDWELPSEDLGEITDISLWLYHDDNRCNPALSIHELDPISWVETQATWNIYSTGNNWSTAGGDYDSTIIDTVTTSYNSWFSFDILGSGATNPLSLTWGDTVQFLIRHVTENDSECSSNICSKNYNNSNCYEEDIPYLEITYIPNEEENPLASTTVSQYYDEDFIEQFFTFLFYIALVLFFLSLFVYWLKFIASHL